ncbi:unnamed protein product [Caenorhabditis sp. 36 PRJEB53466]|nr:unnamed protein product [Caenorhabditis sp. 36 PRJEB53466]
MSGRQSLFPATPSTHGVLSKERRRFIVVTFFDASVTILLWLLCTVTRDDDWKKVFFNEFDILNPQFIKVSLFDVVILAMTRVMVLSSYYGVFLGQTWHTVAFITFISSTYILTKVLLFFNHSSSAIAPYLLIIVTFTLCWAEFYLMPFQILPRERSRVRESRRNLESFENAHFSTDDEIQSEHRHRRLRRQPYSGQLSEPDTLAPSRMSAAVFIASDYDEFRSAPEFSSDEEARSRLLLPPDTRRLFEITIRQCYDQVEELIRDYRLGGWKTLRSDGPTVLQGPDNYFLVQAKFDQFPALVLFNIAWKDMLKWNTQVIEGRMIAHLDNATDLFYSVSAPAMRGYISSRDFLDLRRIQLDSANNVHTGYFVSVESNLCSSNESSKVVRGHNFPSMIRTRRTEDGVTCFEWLMKTDLKGGLPRRLVHQGMVSYFIEHLRIGDETEIPMSTLANRIDTRKVPLSKGQINAIKQAPDILVDLEEFQKIITSKSSQTSTFKRLMYDVADPVISTSQKIEIHSYIDSYSWCPPPVFILLITLAQIAVFVTYWKVEGRKSIWIDCAGCFVYKNHTHPGPLIFAPKLREEAWRFTTYMFLHAGLNHLLGNVIIQLLVGIPLEPLPLALYCSMLLTQTHFSLEHPLEFTPLSLHMSPTLFWYGAPDRKGALFAIWPNF